MPKPHFSVHPGRPVGGTWFSGGFEKAQNPAEALIP